ncbi:alpha-L-fucosidase [Candidatus Desantisbacteria bacterium CG_4_10_14_0_8_um_filter_48_22]|uniref:alpha-L-fucosidase n=1 Tax=Candidatus Desantisbacteria bacterium CG_4_10_14_0_8_um_filter_48_22 TaxID=1974543 RepID=A0A2M7SCB4_9BACT|nr:MAG: hypothetical protein AUJ67_02135 [Candidatus Desantisbacteria bacterium CG1_02_49_89]PIV55168.1 MAG: alpha-L-fucosidase [Candidatus Desantisbacteria bacterium CG02_land_8_20_14_3_00_49_13]PIZ17138.1 MAG: alpha-L-fucosidase [Candidatus Desantisbacteria bacterium CG_4_10_14_0_8_um_filter_48_22]PJB27729.1 MAG: alpha-L-fucosidase [Candidatus Desantisbacteria bacterium CG_4_9_14_3_um_filter_50_7]
MTGSKKHRLALPSPAQAAWQDLEIGMFIHFAPNTWQDQHYDMLYTPLSEINPKELDAAQWVDVAESMNAKYIVFTAKHCGGFCMWPTKTTDYSVKSIPWRKGKGDICGDLAKECRKRKMPLGFYLSPRDDHFGITTSGIARSGRSCHQELYNKIYRQQLEELCTGYGKLVEIWFDGGADGDLAGPVIKKYQPEAMVFGSNRATIRWVGNEDGVAPYPARNTVSNNDKDWSPERNAAAGGKGTKWMPAECDVAIRRDWFWFTTNEGTLKSLDKLMDIYYRSVGHGCNLLLNHTPDRTGLIPSADVERAAEFGIEIKNRFSSLLAETKGKGSVFELDLEKDTVIKHFVAMEDIRHGERVRAYRIEVLANDEWKTIVTGSAVGHKKIDRIEPVMASRARLRVLKSAGTPVIRSFAIY